MDIANVAMTISNLETGSQISTALLSKALDTNETLGAGLIEMIDSAAMERSVNPHLGNSIDLYL